MVYNLESIQKLMTSAGLDDHELFDALRFKDSEDVLVSILPGCKVELTPEADGYLNDSLQ